MLEKVRSWPPDYDQVYDFRIRMLRALEDPKVAADAFVYYSTRPAEFITCWCDTYDPRNSGRPGKLTRIPLVLFDRQIQFVEFLHSCLTNEQSGLIEKSRDMGATWAATAYSVWLWIFYPGASIGWGSRKADLVHRQGDMDSIFEKIFYIINSLPRALLPEGFYPERHTAYMKAINPETGASITGESGDEIGRGGRKLIYFKDESAHYERPEKIEAALADNTRVQIDISSVAGLGNVFHRRRESGVDWEPGMEIPRGRTLVFVMDWRDHPDKSQAWYDERKSKFADEGLLHVFAQEVDRNYAAAVENVIVPAEWVASAIDAHLKIEGLEEGRWMSALDVADGGGDRNALTMRKGVVLKYADEWGAKDTGETTRRAIAAAAKHAPIEMQYDSIGVGAGVKAESNRLASEGLLPKGVKLISWDAGSGPMMPDKRVVEYDNQSPLNKDFYANLKAQGWWKLRIRFEKTHRAMTEKGVKFSPDDLISLDSKSLGVSRLRQIQKELSQPTHIQTARLKLMVDKAPDGTRSPNVADSIMMCYHPVRPAYDSSLDWVSGGKAA